MLVAAVSVFLHMPGFVHVRSVGHAHLLMGIHIGAMMMAIIGAGILIKEVKKHA
jgi:hypothetical protein